MNKVIYITMMARTIMKCEYELCQRPGKIINRGEYYMQPSDKTHKDMCIQCYAKFTHQSQKKHSDIMDSCEKCGRGKL
jgi:hypothetical protein